MKPLKAFRNPASDITTQHLKMRFSKLFKVLKQHANLTELITQNLSRKRFVTTIVLDEQYVVKLKIDYSDDLERFEDFKREFFKN